MFLAAGYAITRNDMGFWIVSGLVWCFSLWIVALGGNRTRVCTRRRYGLWLRGFLQIRFMSITTCT